MSDGGWRNTGDGVGWHDGGDIELRYADGRIVRAVLWIDAWPDGEDEVPVAMLNDWDYGFSAAEQWRPA